MVYEVTYQVGGDEQTDVVDAPDAAGAAASVRDSHTGGSDRFELLLVHLVEGDNSAASAVGLDESGSAAEI